jgi:uncharacterized membrane protein YhaH (DUF805 family)
MDSKIEKLQSCLALFRDMPEASILINYRSRNNMLTFDERLSVTQAIDKAFAPVFLEMGAIIALCSLKGTEGPNNYGPDPNVVTQPASETI